MKKETTLSDVELKRILQKKISISKIAKKYKVAMKTVYRWLHTECKSIEQGSEYLELLDKLRPSVDTITYLGDIAESLPFFLLKKNYNKNIIDNCLFLLSISELTRNIKRNKNKYGSLSLVENLKKLDYKDIPDVNFSCLESKISLKNTLASKLFMELDKEGNPISIDLILKRDIFKDVNKEQLFFATTRHSDILFIFGMLYTKSVFLNKHIGEETAFSLTEEALTLCRLEDIRGFNILWLMENIKSIDKFAHLTLREVKAVLSFNDHFKIGRSHNMEFLEGDVFKSTNLSKAIRKLMIREMGEPVTIDLLHKNLHIQGRISSRQSIKKTISGLKNIKKNEKGWYF